VFVGIVYGFVAGIFLWYIPSKDCVSKRNLLVVDKSVTSSRQKTMALIKINYISGLVKYKKKPHIIGKIPKYNRTIVETGKVHMTF